MSEHRLFDGTSPTAEFHDRPQDDAPHDGYSAQEAEPTGLDALDLLREAVQEREAAPAPELVDVPIPGLGWRLKCDPDFTYAQYRDWQKAGLPPKQKAGKRPPNALDMDRALTASLVLVNTCVGVEMQRRDGEWSTVVNSRGDAVSLRDREFLDRFNMVDPRSLLRKLFTLPGRSADAALIKAGDLVVAAAGYADDEGEEADPTD